MKDTYDAAIAVFMFNFIQFFLKPRSIQVKVNETLSDTKSHIEAISHESVISLTFFILKVNKITVSYQSIIEFKTPTWTTSIELTGN